MPSTLSAFIKYSKHLLLCLSAVIAVLLKWGSCADQQESSACGASQVIPSVLLKSFRSVNLHFLEKAKKILMYVCLASQ